MLTFDDARQRILATVPTLRFEQVSLHEGLGRVLAEDIRARRDAPPWDNTAVDGFAVQAADTCGASADKPVALSIIETVAAGIMPSMTVGPGQATRIMTGAPMPAGANAVVMVEDTDSTDNQVHIKAAAEETDNIRPQGEDVRAGDVVLATGTELKPAHLGMCAQLGRSQFMVSRRPIVAILSTGDELAELDEPLTEEKILNVNSHAIAAQVVEAGAIPLRLGIAKDTPDAIRAGIQAGLEADVLLISGGVSMGDFDFVKPIMDELGGGLDFWKVRIKPARPLAFGVIGGVPTFGLPGNPVSSMVSFELFVRPFLRQAMGHQNLDRPVIHATLAKPIKKSPGRRFFLRAHVIQEDNGYRCHITGSQGSGMLTSMVQADGLIDLAEDLAGPIPAGTTVPVRLL
jgi:molybdopterin molybdotransferase